MIHTRALILLLSGALLSGCAKTETTLEPAPQPNPEPELATNVRQRVTELLTRADEYAAGSAKLPGRNEAEDRAQTTQQFALLAQILPILNGPDMTGEFSQQLRIVEATRTQLSNATPGLSLEPTISAGLRAAQRALASINQRAFNEVPEIGAALDTMRAKVDELDGLTGPIQRLVSAQAVHASSDAISKMVSVMHDRMGKGKPSDAKSADTKPVDAKPADAKPVDGAANQTKAAEEKK